MMRRKFALHRPVVLRFCLHPFVFFLTRADYMAFAGMAFHFDSLLAQRLVTKRLSSF